ncbi:hypothetical protein FB451DRAFT_940701, partial [Mycena latifolia]
PSDRHGDRALIIINWVNILFMYPEEYYIWRNRQRAKISDAMSPEERPNYLRTTMDTGNRCLDFRFV